MSIRDTFLAAGVLILLALIAVAQESHGVAIACAIAAYGVLFGQIWRYRGEFR